MTTVALKYIVEWVHLRVDIQGDSEKTSGLTAGMKISQQLLNCNNHSRMNQSMHMVTFQDNDRSHQVDVPIHLSYSEVLSLDYLLHSLHVDIHLLCMSLYLVNILFYPLQLLNMVLNMEIYPVTLLLS